MHPGFSCLLICTFRKPGFKRARNHSLSNPEVILNGNEGLRIHHGGESLVRKRETRITKASIGITIMFLICNTPRVIPNLVEVLMDQKAFPKVKNIFQSVHNKIEAVYNIKPYNHNFVTLSPQLPFKMVYLFSGCQF